jgi:hypothetical protein
MSLYKKLYVVHITEVDFFEDTRYFWRERLQNPLESLFISLCMPAQLSLAVLRGCTGMPGGSPGEAQGMLLSNEMAPNPIITRERSSKGLLFTLLFLLFLLLLFLLLLG